MPNMLSNGEPLEDVNDDLVTCRDCGDEHEQDHAIDGDSVCEDCFSSYYMCEDCEGMVHADDTTSVNGRIICDHCIGNYSSCSSCDEYVADGDSVTIGWDTVVCETCLSDYYSYCDGCDEYYYSYDGDRCCTSDCDCESPRQLFSFPANGGEDTIEQDERVKITLAAGIISAEGLEKIYQLVRDAGAARYRERVAELAAEGKTVYDLPGDDEVWTTHEAWNSLAADVVADDSKIGNEWQGQRGNYTRRLRRYAHQTYKISLPDSLITEVGNVARAQSMGTDVEVEFTRDLNMSASDFYHEASCWWSDYSESRCSLKSNGGIGMRSFGTTTYPIYGYQTGPWKNPSYAFQRMHVEIGQQVSHDVVTGRAWVMPVNLGDEYDGRDYDYSINQWVTKKMRKWEPTFDSTTPDGYVVFNGYGALSDYAPARIVAEMTGMTYRKVGFDCEPMYVNNGGYLVTSQEIMDTLSDEINIAINTEIHSNLHQKELTANAA
jgi:hypothetical protein